MTIDYKGGICNMRGGGVRREGWKRLSGVGGRIRKETRRKKLQRMILMMTASIYRLLTPN